MNQDCLKLTTYIGERQRTEHSFLADTLADLYGERKLETSILLRGIEGFGPNHHLRTDRFLTLSEDLPIAAVAVDAREKIEHLLADVLAVRRHSLVTLERTRLLTGEVGSVVPEATTLTIYLGRQERIDSMPAFMAVCALLHKRGIHTATVILGVDGTVHGRRERARFFSRNADVPMAVIAVGASERIAQAQFDLRAALHRPTMTLERAQLCKCDGKLLEGPDRLRRKDEDGRWQKLTLYTDGHAHHDGQPIHRLLLGRLRQSGAAGATVLRGVWGFHGRRRPHGDRLLQLGRRVPVVTTIIDTPERIARSSNTVDELTGQHGVVTTEMIPAATVLGGQQGLEALLAGFAHQR